MKPWHGPWLLAAAALALVASIPKPGLTWDEPGYLAQGQQYADWLGRALTAGAGSDDPVWATVHPDHPPLGKLVYGLAAAVRPPALSALVGARRASALLFAVLVALTAYTALRLFGETAAWLAGGSLLLSPQVLAHAQLVSLDLPMTVAWMGTAAVSLAGPAGWIGAVLLGVLWGVALLTKVNGIFLAGPLFAWGLLTRRMRWREVPVVCMAAAATCWIGWPWLRYDTLSHLQAYLLDKQVRWIVPTYYMGHVYNDAYPPWHYPLVLAVATLPWIVLVGVVVGGWRLVRERPAGVGWIGVHLVFTLGLACLPGVPRYDGTRLFLSALPFLAIVAGIGLDRLIRTMASVPRIGWRGARAALALAVASVMLSIRTLAPCLLSSYSPVVGGLPGAAQLGFETTFWGDAVTPELLSWIPEGARVGAVPMGIEYVRALQDARLLPARATAAPEDRCDVLIVLDRKGMLSPEYRRRFETSPALAETRRGGVALARLLHGTS
jgi:hypothetical protein